MTEQSTSQSIGTEVQKISSQNHFKFIQMLKSHLDFGGRRCNHRANSQELYENKDCRHLSSSSNALQDYTCSLNLKQ